MAISTAIDNSARARTVGIKTQFKDLRPAGTSFVPQRIALIGQGNSASTYATTKRSITSSNEAATLYGFGSPIHEAAKQLFPASGDGVGAIPVTVYPLDAGGAAVAALGDVVATGTATRQFTGRLRIGGVLSDEFVIPSGTLAAAVGTLLNTAINDVLDMPVSSVVNVGTDGVDLTAKWLGETGNDVLIEIDAPTDAGITFAITPMATGAVAPDVQVALVQIGDIWETLIVNAAVPYTDTTTLDEFSVYGEGRFDPLVRKPLVAFTGTFETVLATLQAAGDARRTDRTNVLLSVPGSTSTPWAIAARAASRVVRIADNNPARDYGRATLTGIVTGTDAEQWTYTQRDLLIKAGIATTQVRDGVSELSDTVTFFHPLGETDPAYRFVKEIVKLQQVIFNTNLIFDTAEWDGAPLIPDDQPTTNRDARKPKAAVAAVNRMIDSLGLAAIISDPATAKTRTLAGINISNPNRLDVSMTVQLSGNANIRSIDLDFGFFFGTLPTV